MYATGGSRHNRFYEGGFDIFSASDIRNNTARRDTKQSCLDQCLPKRMPMNVKFYDSSNSYNNEHHRSASATSLKNTYLVDDVADAK
jgi:hypothetical protein